jgi:hypothetical protein
MDAERHRLRKAGGSALATAGLAVIGVATLGCNLAIGAGDYGVGGSWGCVGSVTPPVAKAGAEVTLTLEATLFTTGGPFQGLTIRACDQNDMTCATPIGPAATTGASGEATLTVSSGFEGYVDATATGMMESLIYLSRPVVGDATYGLNVGTYDEYAANVMSAAGTVSPEDGALWINTEDCLGQPAAGVALSLDAPWNEGADAFYFQNGAAVDVQTQDETSINASVGGFTDVAIGGFANVTPGRPALTATLTSNGELYAQFAVYVRRQNLTVVLLEPTPLSQ